ncbi:nuclear transport factor 2 family protein [Pseudofrankia asymbiotica]|uniref:SnoaL-like domain-containing protein n=1 Tax=Pseudofrankia asymbiotica TaxID=1834516 RepID=A0A1V2I7J5_9ACTN|nr:nuclear transport factor 2 family protein [Pseudofrankia asymbiotica]ONH28010.1 hypothetical protein BL253_20615 [Pseudofrankia asymbiotica]
MGYLDDTAALTELSYRYARAIDSKDYDALATLFTPTATFDYNHADGEQHALESWLAGTRRLEQLDGTQHFFTNHEFDIDGDAARGQFNMIAQHVRRGLPGGSLLMIGGIYRDTYVRTDGRWLVATRSHEAKWATGNHDVLWGWYEELS